MAEIYSIRDSLQGSLQTFVRNSGLDSTFFEELVRDFVVSLAAYREEDKPLFPTVFVAHSREDLTPILTTGTPLRIGCARRADNPANMVLKDCAALAKEGWAIFLYIEGEDEIHYGVFRSARHSLSTGADEVIADLGESAKLMMLRNCGHQSVELFNSSGGRLILVLKVPARTYSALDTHIEKLATSVTVNNDDPQELRGYMKRLLTKAIQHCHGTLIAVIPSTMTKEEVSAKLNGVIPDPHLDLAELHANAMRLRDADSLADLRSAELILEGMINSDGIVVFSSDAKIRGYRVFVQASAEEEPQLGSDGGARKRAFSILKLRFGSPYLAALYHSQDGETKCEVLADA